MPTFLSEGRDSSRTGDMATGTDVRDARWSRGLFAYLLAGTVCLILLWSVPWLGLTVSAVVLLLATPVGAALQQRLTVLITVGLGVSTLLFAVLRLPIALWVVQATFAGSLIAVGAAYLVRRRPVQWVEVDAATGVIVTAIALLFLLMYVPFIGADTPSTLAGLFGGWDHSSHFALYAGSTLQETTEFVTQTGEPGFGINYPSVLVWTWAALTPALVGGTPTTAAELVAPYVFLSALTTALALGMLCSAASDIAAKLSGQHRLAGAAGALVCGLTFVVGGATEFQDQGHVNFLLVVAVGMPASWYAIQFLGQGRALLSLTLMACATLLLLIAYPPIVATLGPAWVWILWRVTSGRAVLRWAAAVAAVAVTIAAGARLGMAPDRLWSAVDTLVPLTGGLQPFDVMVVAVAPAVALLLARQAYVRGGIGPALGLAGSLVGLSCVALAFVWRTRLLDIPLGSSYYTLKLLLGIWLIGTVLLSVVTALWFCSYLSANSGEGGPLRGGWAALAWGVLALVVGGAAGYVGPNYSALPSGSPIAPGLSAFDQRNTLVHTSMEGPLVMEASGLLTDPGSQPILWDGGDLKNNHYLMALNGLVGEEPRALVSQMPSPFAQPAADVLSDYLAAHPDKSVQIAFSQETSGQVLRKLQRQFPDQVILRQMS